MSVTFITGNQSKADYLAKYLGFPVDHQKVDQDEIQALDLQAIVEHKAKQAYELLHSPVLVEDVALEFKGMGRLPGPFIKWFLAELSAEELCRLVDGKDRTAIGRTAFGYYDGTEFHLFEGSISGRIAEHPAGTGGFGWDSIFIVDGYEVTRAELNEVAYQKVYRQIRPLDQIKTFLEARR